MLAIYIAEKGVVHRMYRELLQIKKKKDKQSDKKNGQKIYMLHSGENTNHQ